MVNATKTIEDINKGVKTMTIRVHRKGEPSKVHQVLHMSTHTLCGVDLHDTLAASKSPGDTLNCDKCQGILDAAEFAKTIKEAFAKGRARMSEGVESCEECPDYDDCANPDKKAPSPKGTGDRDPNGKDAHEPGAKLDADKPRMGLVLGGFARALTEVAKVGTMGAKKYTDNGWMQVPNGVARYEDALLRHFMTDDMYDDESGLMHYAHMAWCALAVLELALREQED